MEKKVSDKETIAKLNEWFKSNGLEIATILTEKDHTNKVNGFYNEVESKSGKTIKVPDFNGLSDYFIDLYKPVLNGSGFWVYENQHYKPIQKRTIKNLIDKITLKKVIPGHYERFIEKIFAQSAEENRDFLSTKDLVNLDNGILNVRTKELLPHSPQYFFKYKLKHRYDIEIKSPKFLNFLHFIFENDQEQINLVSEIFGYCLAGGSPWLHKAFVFFGEGRNGKSTLLDILKNMLGEANVSAVSLSYLDKPFSVVSLDGKLANIVDETPNDKLNAEMFKLATSGGSLRAAQKNQPEYDLQVNARFVFACNKMPQFHESTTGLIERLCFVKFGKYIEAKERDHKIKDEILKHEMTGIINFALYGLDRLLERGHLPDLVMHEHLMDEYRKETDSVYDWATERLEINIHNQRSKMLTSNLYENYQIYCTKTGRSSVNMNNFSKRLNWYFKGKLNGHFSEMKVHTEHGNAYKFVSYKSSIFSDAGGLN